MDVSMAIFAAERNLEMLLSPQQMHLRRGCLCMKPARRLPRVGAGMLLLLTQQMPSGRAGYLVNAARES